MVTSSPVHEATPMSPPDAAVQEADDDSDCSSDVMDIDPLLSDCSEDETTPPTSPAHNNTPLFLHVSFTIKTTPEGLSCDIKERSCDPKDFIKENVPLCLCKSGDLVTYHMISHPSGSYLTSLSADEAYYVSMELEFLSYNPTHRKQEDNER